MIIRTIICFYSRSIIHISWFSVVYNTELMILLTESVYKNKKHLGRVHQMLAYFLTAANGSAALKVLSIFFALSALYLFIILSNFNVQLWVKRSTHHGHFLPSSPIRVENNTINIILVLQITVSLH